MIKKKLFYISVNGSDSPSTIELYDIYNKSDFVISIAKELRTTRPLVKILSRRDNILSVFSVLDFLVSIDYQFTLAECSAFIDGVTKYIQDIPVSELFFLWLTQFSTEQIESQRDVPESIMESFGILTGDVVAESKNWKDNFDRAISSNEQEYEDLQDRMTLLFENQCEASETTPFDIRRIRTLMTIPFDHSLYDYFDKVKLSREWTIALYQDMVRTEMVDHLSKDVFSDILEQRNRDHLVVYHQDMEQFVSLGHPPSGKDVLHLMMDIKPQEDMNTIRRQIYDLFRVESSSGPLKTLSVSGSFYIKNHMFDKLTFHDFIMNDTVAQKYMHINELEKATRFGENVTVHFENNISAILVNSKTDVSVKPPILSYFRGDYVKVNITRATGSPNDLDNVFRFQQILCSLLRRYTLMYEEYQQLYLQLLPAITFYPLRKMTEEEQQDVRNFAEKYKNVFKKTGYKTSCRPKSRMPTIITETDAKAMNPLRVLKFPKDGDTTLGIPQEFLTCTDPEYPFPGIASLSGGNLFVPCCFNKNPRSSRAFLEYYRGEKDTQPKGTEHVKSEFQIIKTFGDVGKLPSVIHQFLIALMPDKSFYRMGTHDSPCTTMHSLQHLVQKETKTDRTLRNDLMNFFGTNLNVCKQENPDMSLDQIQEAIGLATTYLDPRRYIRLLETYYNLNIVVFVKDKKTEEVTIMTPHFKSFHVRSLFVPDRPFAFLYEHWGTSPDRYTKRLHPVCEMIVSDDDLRLYDVPMDVLRNLDNVYEALFPLYPIRQNVPPLPAQFIVRQQILDTYGKARGLILEMETDKYFYVEATQPFPPVYIENENAQMFSTIQIPTVNFVDDFIKGTGTISQMVSFQTTRYVQWDTMGMSWKIQVRSSNATLFSPISFPFLTFSPPVRDERISTISKQKQLARIVLDYVLFLYSKFFLSREDNDNYDLFFESHTKIQDNYVYPKKINEAIMTNPLIMTDDVLIIPSKGVRQRLLFNIRYYKLYKLAELKHYMNHTTLPHFWESPYDFSSWRHVFYVPVLERLLDRPTYLETNRLSLTDLKESIGYWYNPAELPPLGRRAPLRYVKVEDEAEAISMTMYWNKNGIIPSFKLDVDPSFSEGVTVHRFDPIKGLWTPEIDMLDTSTERVLVSMSSTMDMYVLLQLKN